MPACKGGITAREAPGDGLVRYEVGFGSNDIGLGFKHQLPNPWDEEDLGTVDGISSAEILEVILETSVWVRTPPPGRSKWATINAPSHQAGRFLAEAYAAATTARPAPPSRLVESGRPLVVVEHPEPWLLIDRRALRRELREGVWQISLRPSGNQARVLFWMLDTNLLSTSELRELRIHFSRIHTTRETLRTVLGWLSASEEFTPTDEAEAFLHRAEKLLRRKSLNGFPVSDTLAAAYEFDLLVSPADYANLPLQLELMSKKTKRQLEGLIRQNVYDADSIYVTNVDVRDSSVGALTGSRVDGPSRVNPANSKEAVKYNTKGTHGETMENNVEINVTGSTTGHIVGIVKDSRDLLNTSQNDNQVLQEAVAELIARVEGIGPSLSEDDQKKVGSDLKAVAEEAAKEEPGSGIIKAHLDRMMEIVARIGAVATPVATAIGAIMKILGG